MKTETVLGPPARMVEFKTIAVLSDLAGGAETPLRYAASLARWYGSRLIIAHAISPDFFLYMPPMPMGDWEPALDTRKDAEERARSMAAGLGLRDAEPQILARKSDIAGLLKELQDRRPDLLVMSTHGREGIAKWLSGSVAEQVFRTVDWPVLVLGPGTEGPPPLQIVYQRILYATDLSPASAAALRYAAGIARDHDAHLTCVYVEPDTSEQFSFNRGMARQRLEDWMEKHAAGLTEALKGTSCEVELGKPWEKISEAARLLHADLIVTGARGLGALAGVASHVLGGTAYHLVCSAACPVLVVPHR